MSKRDWRTDYDWTYYELDEDSDPVSSLDRLVEGETHRQKVVNLTDKPERIQQYLSESPMEMPKSSEQETSLESEISELCNTHQQSKEWFGKQDLETKIRTIEQYSEEKLEDDDLIPDEIAQWFNDMSEVLNGSDKSAQKTALQNEAFEDEVVSLSFIDSINKPAVKFDLVHAETIVLILQTGYIIMEMVEKQYKYKPHKKIKEKSPNIKQRIRTEKKDSIKNEVTGKSSVKNEVQSALDEYNED